MRDLVLVAQRKAVQSAKKAAGILTAVKTRADRKSIAAVSAAVLLLAVIGAWLFGSGGRQASLGTDNTVDSQSSIQTNVSSVNQAPVQPDSSDSTDNSGSSSTTSNNTSVTVNGHSVTAPANGTVRKVIKDSHGNTTVEISQTTNNSSGDTSSSVDLNTDSSSYIDSDSQQSADGGGM